MDMLERVGLVLLNVDRARHGLPPFGTVYLAPDHEQCLADACTVIEAMREPTPEMLAEAWAGITKDKNRAGIWRLGPGPGASDVWRAMIDAALSSSSPAAGR